MPFMKPRVTCEPFHVAQNRFRDREACPADVWGTLDRFMDEIGTRDEDREAGETITDKWWGRMSAAGYLDATDWVGPFDSEHEAYETLADIHGDGSEDEDDEDSEEL